MLLFPPHVGFEDWSDGEMPVDGGDTIPLNLLHSSEKVTIFFVHSGIQWAYHMILDFYVSCHRFGLMCSMN